MLYEVITQLAPGIELVGLQRPNRECEKRQSDDPAQGPRRYEPGEPDTDRAGEEVVGERCNEDAEDDRAAALELRLV